MYFLSWVLLGLAAWSLLFGLDKGQVYFYISIGASVMAMLALLVAILRLPDSR